MDSNASIAFLHYRLNGQYSGLVDQLREHFDVGQGTLRSLREFWKSKDVLIVEPALEFMDEAQQLFPKIQVPTLIVHDNAKILKIAEQRLGIKENFEYGQGVNFKNIMAYLVRVTGAE